MIQIDIDKNVIEEMAKQAIEERLKEFDKAVYFMDSKAVTKYVGMSWNSFDTHILNDPNFTAAIRLGNKWLFNRAELDIYLNKFFIAVRDSGGQIQKYTKR